MYEHSSYYSQLKLLQFFKRHITSDEKSLRGSILSESIEYKWLYDLDTVDVCKETVFVSMTGLWYAWVRAAVIAYKKNLHKVG